MAMIANFIRWIFKLSMADMAVRTLVKNSVIVRSHLQRLNFVDYLLQFIVIGNYRLQEVLGSRDSSEELQLAMNFSLRTTSSDSDIGKAAWHMELMVNSKRLLVLFFLGRRKHSLNQCFRICVNHEACRQFVFVILEFDYFVNRLRFAPTISLAVCQMFVQDSLSRTRMKAVCAKELVFFVLALVVH